MIILGVVLLVVGLLIGLHWLFILGCVLAVVGVLLLLLGAFSHPVGGRRHWF